MLRQEYGAKIKLLEYDRASAETRYSLIVDTKQVLEQEIKNVTAKCKEYLEILNKQFDTTQSALQ